MFRAKRFPNQPGVQFFRRSRSKLPLGYVVFTLIRLRASRVYNLAATDVTSQFARTYPVTLVRRAEGSLSGSLWICLACAKFAGRRLRAGASRVVVVVDVR